MPCTSEEFQRIAGLIRAYLAVDLTRQNDAMARCVDRVATECARLSSRRANLCGVASSTSDGLSLTRVSSH